MDLTIYVANFNLLSKLGKIMLIFDYFVLGNAAFNQKYFFINVVYESSSTHAQLFVASLVENAERYLFCFFGTKHF